MILRRPETHWHIERRGHNSTGRISLSRRQRSNELVRELLHQVKKTTVPNRYSQKDKFVGSLFRARHTETVAGFDKTQYSLREIPIGFSAGLIFVNLDRNCEPLKDTQTGLISPLRSTFRTLNDSLPLTD